MNIVEQLKLFTLFAGSGIALSEVYSAYAKNKLNKIEKLAKGHIINKNDIKDMTGTDGLIISKDIQLKEKFDFEGSTIIGPTGSGKTTSFFFTNLLSNNLKGSIIVTDPKGELFKLTSEYQEKVCKRKVLKFKPLSPNESEKYNLLTSCKDDSEVIELANNLLINGALSIELATGKATGGAEWVQMAEPLLAAALLYAKRLEYPFNNIEFAFKLLTTLSTEQLNELFSNSKNNSCIEQWNIFKMVSGADRTEGSIKITLATNMKLFADYNINSVGSENTFNIEDLRKESTILYVIYPEHKSNYLAPFIAPFFTQIINKLVESYNNKSLPVTFLFDEFANVGLITNMSTIVSTIRSRKISMNICLQSLTQLYQIYGMGNAKAILNNLKTKIVLPGLSDIETTNYLSDVCGNKEITVCNTNMSAKSENKSYSKTKIKIFESSDIRCLEDNQMIVITSNKQPLISVQNRYYENDRYTNNIIKKDNDPEPKFINKYSKRDIEKEVKNIIENIVISESVEDVKASLFR